ncbi:MAG: SDR family NAD(P)-dependent oxidoreductase [Rhodobacteraceae bacterium]|nr:SDR family NAD(P)-dependent oxidoreductase [Paracoccaceae bacterium]
MPDAAESEVANVALITGATGGLGRACALELTAMGYCLVATGRTPGALADLKEDIDAAGGSVSLAALDLADSNAITGMIAAIATRWNRLDLVIHTAIHSSSLTPVPHINDLARAMQVNVLATATLIQQAEPLLDAGSTVVFCQDIHTTGKFSGAYGASKAAQIALACQWQQECRKIGPDIVIFQPERMPTRCLRKHHPGISSDNLTAPAIEARRLLTELGLESERCLRTGK